MYYMMVTFEIAPADEAEFNAVYDTEHIPNILKLHGVTEVIRFKDPAPNDKGLLTYSALYLMETEDLHLTPAWSAVSDLGRWAPVIRPKIKSRARRAGPVVARVTKAATLAADQISQES